MAQTGSSDAGRVRRVQSDEFVALFELERVASLAGLGHVFPVEEFPFPDEEVLAKYRLWFEDPDFRALAVERGRRMIAHVGGMPFEEFLVPVILSVSALGAGVRASISNRRRRERSPS